MLLDLWPLVEARDLPPRGHAIFQAVIDEQPPDTFGRTDIALMVSVDHEWWTVHDLTVDLELATASTVSSSAQTTSALLVGAAHDPATVTATCSTVDVSTRHAHSAPQALDVLDLL